MSTGRSGLINLRFANAITRTNCNLIYNFDRRRQSIEKTKNRAIINKKSVKSPVSRREDVVMKAITVNGNRYECKRYTYEELKSMFDGKVVVLEDTVLENMNLVSGVLVDAFDVEKKIIMRQKYIEKHINEGKKYTLWDLSPEPVFVGYRGYA